MEEKDVRINKYLAEAGICSRREADRLVQEGLVRINGKLAESGSKVRPLDEVTLRGKKVSTKKELHVLAYYKPVGVTCTEKDPHAKRVVTKEFDYPVRVTYAGRLDRDSEGLLLLTNDGNLIDRLMRGSNHQEKEYVVKVDRRITPDFLKAMAEGIYLKELDRTTRPCHVEEKGGYTFSIILTQGLNRQIRRMCESLGYSIRSLKRIRVANIRLEGMKPGEVRRIQEKELEELYRQIEEKQQLFR